MDYIYSYTRAQAIRDGVLVDVSKIADKADFKCPVAITKAVYTTIKEAEIHPFITVSGMVFHILFMASMSMSVISEVLFNVIIPGKGGLKLKAVCSSGDDMKPVITIMYPNED